jgi:hypothetical protein
VSLLGTADAAFWKARLHGETLALAESDRQAQILIVAADAKFLGVRFRELSFSALVSQPDGAYLTQAFNSCRLFAFCERVLFSTPYDHGDVRVSASFPPSIQLSRGGEVVFRAELQAGASAPRREPSRRGEGGWEGPVFLPASRRRTGHSERLFFARITGHTQTYPFLPGQDSMTIRPSPADEVLQALIDSHFVGREWAVREDATHAKSKTYKRSEALAGLARG